MWVMYSWDRRSTGFRAMPGRFSLWFDVASNTGFNRKLRYHAYLAYGFSDKNLKDRANFFTCQKDPNNIGIWAMKRSGFWTNYYGEISQDNIFYIRLFVNLIFPKNI